MGVRLALPVLGSSLLEFKQGRDHLFPRFRVDAAVSLEPARKMPDQPTDGAVAQMLGGQFQFSLLDLYVLSLCYSFAPV